MTGVSTGRSGEASHIKSMPVDREGKAKEKKDRTAGNAKSGEKDGQQKEKGEKGKRGKKERKGGKANVDDV